MYRCLIVDDEALARGLIKKHLDQLEDFELVASCENAIDARRILHQQHVDLLFLDIEMPVLRGTDFFKNLLNPPKVIFTTAYRDYAIDGFELNAVDYLLKPITFGRFLTAIEKFLNQQSTHIPSFPADNVTGKDFMFVRKDRKQVKVNFQDILYIESVKDYIKIHLLDQSHMVKYSLTAFEKELDTRFLRTHRSYIVNTDKITAYTKYDVEIGVIEIPVGERHREMVMKRISK